MSDPRVNGSSALRSAPQANKVEDQMLDILNSRMNEYTKVAELKKVVEKLPESEKNALYERLKDRKSPDPLSQKFHYWLSHRSYKPGALSTVDQILYTLKPSAQKATPAAQDSRTTSPGKGPSPAMIDPKTADSLARSHFVKEEPKPGTPVNVDASVLKPGEKISAKVTTKVVQPYQETTFDFSRPVTKEHAAAIIFQKGQIPPDVKLEKGAGNSWTIKVPNDMEAMQNAASHYNSHTETLVTRERTHEDVFYPKPDVTFEWVGGSHPCQESTKGFEERLWFCY